MLILARRLHESIMIGDQIEISVVDIKGDQVKLGIKAPKQVKVYRQEVYQAIQRENVEAARSSTPERLPELDRYLPKGEPEKEPAEKPPGGPQAGPAAKG